MQKKEVQVPEGYVRIEEYVAFRQTVNRLLELVEKLQLENQLLRAENEELKSRQNKNSGNSHKPPSTDGFKKVIKNNREKSNRKPGAQPGHKGTTLEMMATPDVVVQNKAEGICSCGCNIATQPLVEKLRRQVVDLPVKLIECTEYQIEVRQCSCGKKHYGNMAYLAPVQYGQRIKALAVYLNQQQFVPYDRMQEIFSDLFGVSIGDKILFEANETCYQNLEETEQLIIEALKASPVMHNDETGLRCESKLKWVHVSSTDCLTNYAIHEKRGKEAIDFIGILTDYLGNSVHDRYSSYDKFNCNHSLCNAHLLRELIFLVEEHGKEWATRMIDLLLKGKELKETDKLRKSNREEIFKIYDKLVSTNIPLEEKLQEQNPPNRRGKKPKTKALRLLETFRDRKVQILKFLTHPEVPFDNNQAERDLRMIKLKQKISGTMRTHHGAEVFCRIRGYISTARKQNIQILQAITAAMTGNPVAFS